MKRWKKIKFILQYDVRDLSSTINKIVPDMLIIIGLFCKCIRIGIRPANRYYVLTYDLNYPVNVEKKSFSKWTRTDVSVGGRVRAAVDRVIEFAKFPGGIEEKKKRDTRRLCVRSVTPVAKRKLLFGYFICIFSGNTVPIGGRGSRRS